MNTPSPNIFRDHQPADDPVIAELVPEAQSDPGERITILGLLIWTAGSAIIMGLHRQLHDLPDDPDTSAQWLRTLGSVLSSAVHGAGIASLFLVLGRSFNKGPRFPRQPGHWLLVISGIYAIANTFGYLVLYETFRQEPWTYITYYRLPMLGLVTLLTVVALTQIKLRVDWLFVFLAWLASYFLMIVFACASFDYDLRGAAVILEALIAVGANLLFIIPVAVDYSLRVKRDQLHFVGIAVRLGFVPIQLIAILKEVTMN